MNMLFSDKTGTVTQGNLSLVEFITGNGEILIHTSREFIEAITLNNLAKISSEGKAIGSNNMEEHCSLMPLIMVIMILTMIRRR